MDQTRRQWLLSVAAATAATSAARGRAQDPGDRPTRPAGVEVLNPRERNPVSLIIDDSTCLANLAHFAVPQFAEVFPDRYLQDWRALPREIPDSFVRKFGEWCGEQGVKGKYSIVPYPACVGRLDQRLPGWTRRELEQSLDLVRTLMTPNWDIHPEMVTHTFVIDTKTGHPFPERTERFMENWGWTDNRSADEIADYMAYALRILKNVGLPCTGITTPGGFGNRALPQLARATLDACRDVFGAEIPHYFRHLYTDDHSVAPRVEYAADLDGPNPRCVVSIIGCTGDWFGGWDGLEHGRADQFITADLRGGRLPEVLRRGEPAILVCHWPGVYCNGEETGFATFRDVVRRLNAAYDDLTWMTLSEIARYWAARELTAIAAAAGTYRFKAPYACPAFTIAVKGPAPSPPMLLGNDPEVSLAEVKRKQDMRPGTYRLDGDRTIVCFDLRKGESTMRIPAAEPGR